MKRILIVLFVLFAIQSQAVQVYQKGIGGYIEYGQSLEPVKTYSFTYDEDPEENSTYIGFTDINLHYVFQAWNVQFIPFTSVKMWVEPHATQFYGEPFCDIYTVGAEILWNNISLTVDHYCAHPVHSNEENWQVRDYRMGQNMTEFKIRYSFN